MLGSPTAPDYVAARAARTLERPQTLEAVTSQLVHYLQGMFIWGIPSANQRRADIRRSPA